MKIWPARQRRDLEQRQLEVRVCRGKLSQAISLLLALWLQFPMETRNPHLYHCPQSPVAQIFRVVCDEDIWEAHSWHPRFVCYPPHISLSWEPFSSGIFLIIFNRNLWSSSSCFYGSRAAVAAATFQRHCKTAGDRNNPSSRHNGEISDGSTRDLDGGNFRRWALVPCAGRGTFRRFRSVWGRRDGHFSGRYWRGSCISWRGARKGVKALHAVPCVGRIWEYEQYGRAEVLD